MVYIQNDSGIPLCHPFPVSYEIRYNRVYSEGREGWEMKWCVSSCEVDDMVRYYRL